MSADAHLDDLDNGFDRASLISSLEDSDERRQRSPMFDLPSQHSGFRSEPAESDIDDRSSIGAPWSPPGFRAHNQGATWFRHDPYGAMNLRPSASPSRSRQTSPEYQDAREIDEDVTLAANIPLPPGTDSPTKERSPEPEVKDEEDVMRTFDQEAARANPNNYIRFAMRAEVQHREPFVAFFNFLRDKVDAMTRTKSMTLYTICITILSLLALRCVMRPPVPLPAPDLIKLSTLAKAFEPSIYYSENGYNQIAALQETSVAVWDLGESVRGANIASAPIIVDSLDELSESLKRLGLELTRFSTNVDSDIDSILIVMDWARRELLAANAGQGSTISSVVYDHIHSLLNRGGILESASGPTQLGHVLKQVFGASSPQRTQSTLTRTFKEFLNVLEDSISSELVHSGKLFATFETIDQQFLNLQRTVVRETDTQEQLENDLLSSLWTRVMGANSALLKKFDKNKQLLANVRARTVSNKHMIIEHHGRLQTLKVNLETLRRKLVSPLVRRNDSVSMDNASIVEDQIIALTGTHDYLKGVREKQKSKLMEIVYGGTQSRTFLTGPSQREIASR